MSGADEVEEGQPLGGEAVEDLGDEEPGEFLEGAFAGRELSGKGETLLGGVLDLVPQGASGTGVVPQPTPHHRVTLAYLLLQFI